MERLVKQGAVQIFILKSMIHMCVPVGIYSMLLLLHVTPCSNILNLAECGSKKKEFISEIFIGPMLLHYVALWNLALRRNLMLEIENM